MNVTYKTALITGASSGLGRGLAAWFASAGVRVYAAARRSALLEALRVEAGENVVPFPLDVTRADETHDRIRQLDADCGGLDLVIANAGVGDETDGRHLDWQRVRNVLDVNVTGALATLVAPLPAMIERGHGHLVGVSSLTASLTVPRYTTYAASKTFLTSWLTGMRLDVAAAGVQVTSVHPGFVRSEMTARNKTKMPFMVETADAVARVARAIVRKDRNCSFPWQMHAIAAVAVRLPAEVQYEILKRGM
jgi:short-subunit dehydrogenase